MAENSTQPQITEQETNVQTQNPVIPTKTPHKLNWKAFFIGIIVVVIIEWFAVRALSTDGKQILPSPSPKISPTITTQQTQNWTKYTDRTLGFSFLYPADKISLETLTATQTGTLRIQTFQETIDEKTFSGILEPNELTILKTALEKGIPFSSLQPGEKDYFKTLKLGTNNFVRIYPVDDPMCTCDEIKYITTENDTYIVFTMTKRRTLSPTPQSVTPKTKAQIEKQTKETLQKKLLSDKETVIKNEFGNLEQILNTYQAGKLLDKQK